MKEDKIDQEIREKLQGRVIQPSASAWERLSSQLDEVEQKKKRHWFLYVGYAASIALIVSLFFFLTQSDENASDIPENVIVQEEVKTPENDLLKEFKTVPVEDQVIVDNELETRDLETGRVKNQDTKTQDKLPKKIVPTFKGAEDKAVIAKKKQPKTPEIDVQKTIQKLTQKKETVVADIEIPKGNDSLFNKQNSSNSRISVDSDALLMSVTGTREEIVAYYKKYKIDRAEVLATIEKELKKSSLKVDPKTILAEVEQDVNEENFQNNFYQFIKKRVSTVATAIANRNN
jgi:hypothetical protein